MTIRKYTSGDLEVELSADVVANDFGVFMSPTWYEPKNVEIISVSILGFRVDHTVFHQDLVEAIYELSWELEWHPE